MLSPATSSKLVAPIQQPLQNENYLKTIQELRSPSMSVLSAKYEDISDFYNDNSEDSSMQKQEMNEASINIQEKLDSLKEKEPLRLTNLIYEENPGKQSK